MSNRSPWAALFLIAALSTSVLAADKSTARVEKIGDYNPAELRAAHSLATADTCFVSDNGEIVYRISSWVTGMELYKSLIDPANSCQNPYPFTITEINMPMIFNTGTPLIVSVDIEAVDYTTVAGCPVPGTVLAISQDWELVVPDGGGMYNIWIPLDEPIVVNEPFFAGFFIANQIDPGVGADVLCDSIPIPCTSFNIWDEEVGWIDLTNNELYSFPGRLAMEAAGVPGGSGGGSEPAPTTAILIPADGGSVYGATELWCFDSSGSSIIDYASFEYSSGGSYVEIGRDFDDYAPIRDGINANGAGHGLSFTWNPTGLPEGNYSIRATIYDTLGRSSSNVVQVFVEPTPPISIITTPDNGDDICPPMSVIMNSPDENLLFVQIYRTLAKTNYSAGLTGMSQTSVGDVNGNPSDGNYASNGEFGSYYSGPVAAAVATTLWQNRGLVSGASSSIELITEEFASLFKTRENLGTRDDAMYAGLIAYSKQHGDNLNFELKRNPDYFQLRSWVEEEQRATIIGLSGGVAIYLAVDGFQDWLQPDNSFYVRVNNPHGGILEIFQMRKNGTNSELFYAGSWQVVDVMISIAANSWTISRALLGFDMNGADGWSYDLQAASLEQDSLYFLTAVGRDETNMEASSSVLIKNNCSSVFRPGDYNQSGQADIVDLLLLIDFITKGGLAPSGGGARADANCDNYVNITDIVFYLNFLFGTASTPCY